MTWKDWEKKIRRHPVGFQIALKPLPGSQLPVSWKWGINGYLLESIWINTIRSCPYACT